MKKQLMACLLAAVSCVPAMAEPTSGGLKVVRVRPYLNGGGGPGDVYVHVNQESLCGTNIYVIHMAWGGAKEAVAAAYLALATGKSVEIEVVTNGCANPPWMTPIQSIYVVQ